MVKNEYGQSGLWTIKLGVSQESQKLKADQNFIGWVWSKMGEASPVTGLHPKRTGGITDFLDAVKI